MSENLEELVLTLYLTRKSAKEAKNARANLAAELGPCVADLPEDSACYWSRMHSDRWCNVCKAKLEPQKDFRRKSNIAGAALRAVLRAGRALAVLVLISATCHALPLREALSQIESGGNDHAIGRANEISRFQILPSVWREHTASRNYHNESVAWTVAQRIIKPRQEAFSRAMRREPLPREVYCLWHRPGRFASEGYMVSRMSGSVQARAKRFANLIRAK